MLPTLSNFILTLLKLVLASCNVLDWARPVQIGTNKLTALPVCFISSVSAVCSFDSFLLPLLQAVELLSRQPDIPGREKELMKAVPDMDMINASVGIVKLSMPGLVKIKQDVRKNKKKK